MLLLCNDVVFNADEADCTSTVRTIVSCFEVNRYKFHEINYLKFLF